MTAIADFLEKYKLVCIFKKTFGYDCPGCGFQRAVILFLRGDFYSALKVYPPFLFLLLLVLFFFAQLVFKIKNSELILQYLFRLTFGVVLINYFFKLFV